MNQMEPNSGSFDAPHFAGTDLDGAIARARDLLGSDGDLGHLNQNQRLAWYLLRDACRLATVVPHIVLASKGAEQEMTAEALEVIARKVLEHAIFLEYLHENKQDDKIVEQFLASCRAAYGRANKNFVSKDDKPSNWPNYEQMAATQPALHDLYRRLSYLAHPKTSIPYTLLERDSGRSAAAFFVDRAEHTVIDVAQILHVATDSAWAIGVRPGSKETVRE